ncbi:hypothetical protein B0T17DRAFT_612922 [Bombardia bombarda]|uniref:BZIP domain-containing protein n=1 Tax=Bombardia bombarda TaxID=252184 RepID=A0AA39XM60_9PEZI|nr:hypothetical protein B0T17DRAFT_612922 [Bombardia bombarda]
MGSLMSHKTTGLSLNTLIASHAERGSLSAASTPSSAASPTNVSTPSSSISASTPQIAIQPSTATKPPSIVTSGAINRVAMLSAISPSPTPQSQPLSMTTKEWVIPPRPKPGRKPATDTPPTKRKAQNRAAQRAFRERRAARVGELEEQLDEQKEDHDRTVHEMQDRVTHLEAETQTLQSRCQWLESLLDKERQERQAERQEREITRRNWESAEQPSSMLSRNDAIARTQMQQQQANSMRMPHPGQHVQRTQSTVAMEPPATAVPRPMAQSFSISHIISPPEGVDEGPNLGCGGCAANGPCACAEEALQQDSDIPMGCGNCTMNSRCACLEESIRASIAASDLKRPLPPSSPSSSMAPDEKRQRSDSGMAMEIDFTSMFSSRKQKPLAPAQSQLQSQSQPIVSIEPRDSCGFCKDGTYCVCVESMTMQSSSASAPIVQPMGQQTHTPPPSDDDVVPIPMEVTATGAIKLPSFQSLRQARATNATRPNPPPPARASSGGCGPNGPGTCTQCLSDPKSGLFCRSLAANFERNNRESGSGGSTTGGSGGECCGNGGPSGCCKAGKSDADTTTTTTTLPAPAAATVAAAKPRGPNLGVSLSCADAYKTLASHQHFNEAADDIGSWLPKLRAVPIPDNRGYVARGHFAAGRGPIEVEAASIMSVLKDFDVRFGRGQ